MNFFNFSFERQHNTPPPPLPGSEPHVPIAEAEVQAVFSMSEAEVQAAFGLSKEEWVELAKKFLTEFNTAYYKERQPALEAVEELQEKYPDYAVLEIMNSVYPKPFRPWEKPEPTPPLH